MPAPAKPESVPPVTATSAAVKFDEASLSVNVITACSPARSAALLDAMPIVGTAVSIVSGGARLAAGLPLPAALVNERPITAIVPGAVEATAGVNTAV